MEDFSKLEKFLWIEIDRIRDIPFVRNELISRICILRADSSLFLPRCEFGIRNHDGGENVPCDAPE